MNWNVCAYLWLLLPPTSALACVAATEDDDNDQGMISAQEDERDEKVASAQQELVASEEFVWYQGWGEVPMGTTSGRVCFLTHIQGHFEGGGESVYTRAGLDGSWYLGGTSLQQDVAARARCVYSSYSTYYDWTQGQLPTYMGSSPGRSCFLTRVSGKFKGSGEYVYAYDTGNGWYLGGSSLQQDVSARARCVPYSSWQYNWSQGMGPVMMDSSSTKTCFLMRMTGHFEGGGEQITIFPSGPNWYLYGYSSQAGVGASARCI